MADNYAIQTGDWHDSATWSTGIVPTNADDVYINGGITVTVGTSQTAVCSTLKLYTKNTVSAKGMVLLNAINSTMVVTNTIGFGDTTTATFGNIQIGGNCVTASITYASLAYNTGSSPEGIFRRVGNYQQCTITLNGTTNTNFPSLESNGACIIIYANNSSTTTYDKWIINGNIICSAYQSGAPSFSLFNGNICPAMHLTINGNISYTTGTNGGTSGRLIGTTSSTKEMDITLNGNLYCSVTTTSTNAYGFMMIGIPSTIYGLGKRLRIFGNIFGGSVAAFPLSVSSGNILEHVGEASVYANTYRGIELSGSAVASIGTLKPPATSLGVVSTSTDFIGNLVIDTIDCRSEASSTSNSLLLYNANTVQRETQINTIWSGGCVAYKSTSNLAHIFHVGLLNGSNYVTAPTVAAQPAINTIATPNVKSIIDVITIGNWGSWPISGWWQAKDADSLIYARDTNNATLLFSVENTSQIIPQPSDVRFGVPVGNTVGTYQLSDSYLSSIQQLRNLALAIKAKSDQMTFDTSKLNANVDTTSSLLISEIAEVKAQTDKMNFVEATVTIPGVSSDPSWNNVSFLARFENINGATSSTDERGNVITLSNGPTVSTSDSKFGSSSLSMGSNSTSSVSIPSFAGLNIGTDDYTIEMWVNPLTLGANQTLFSRYFAWAGDVGIFARIEAAGTVKMWMGNSVSMVLGTTNTVNVNTWNHIAFTRESGTTRIFINGIMSGSTTTVGNASSTSTPLLIGGESASGERLNGFIDEFRITNHVARYTADFTLPTTEFPGEGIAGTSTQTQIIASGTSGGGSVSVDLTPIIGPLTSIKDKTDQLSFSNGVITTTDYTTKLDAIKAKTDTIVDQTSSLSAISASLSAISVALATIEATTDKISFDTVMSDVDPYLALVSLKAEYNNGTLNADTGQIYSPLYGNPVITGSTRTGIGALSVSNTAFYYPSSSGLIFTASDFTIEFSVMFSVVPGSGIYGGIISKIWDNATADWLMYISNSKIAFSPSGTNAVSITHPTTIATGVWYDIVVSRTAGTLKMFINGVVSQVSCTGMSISDNGGPLVIGRVNYFSNSSYMNGVIDRIRITKGVGRYSSVDPESPPVSTYPTTTTGTPQSYKVIANCDSGLGPDVTAIKTKTDQLSFSSGKVIADASSVDYTSQLNAITSTVNAISDAVDLIDAVTSKIAFETVYSEGDPNLAQVIFKAEFNGTNGSTVINADTGQTGTNQGSPSLNTAYARTGVSSVALSGSIVSYGNISSLNLGANDFTIEFSVNFSSIVSSVGDYAGVVGKRASNGDFSWICYVTEGKMNFLTSGINAISTAHPTVLSAGAWYDVAISRTGDTLKFYVNGVLSQVSCTGLNIATTTAPFFIGRLSYDISSYHMFGYLDRLRITVGTGRYASVAPVSPPVSEYPTTLNGVAQSYKVVANCDSGTTIPTDLTDRLTDLRNRINAIHFIVKDE